MSAYPFVLTSGKTAQAINTAAPAATSTPTVKDRDTEFRALEGGGEVQPGGVLLIEAYAVMWLLVFVMIVRSIRKQSKLDQRIEQLQMGCARSDD